IERGFVRRVARLPRSARRALVLLAASDVGELHTIRRALEVLELAGEALEPAQREGLVTISSSVVFCHPLARSAIYGSADEGERRAAHRALAAAAGAAGESDRRAWHLAAATGGPDEKTAAALIDAAESARRRGGVGSEAKALERAARLTPEAGLRASRLAHAGMAAHRAGRHERAEALLDEAIAGDLDVSE